MCKSGFAKIENGSQTQLFSSAFCDNKQPVFMLVSRVYLLIIPFDKKIPRLFRAKREKSAIFASKFLSLTSKIRRSWTFRAFFARAPELGSEFPYQFLPQYTKGREGGRMDGLSWVRKRNR